MCDWIKSHVVKKTKETVPEVTVTRREAIDDEADGSSWTMWKMMKMSTVDSMQSDWRLRADEC